MLILEISASQNEHMRMIGSPGEALRLLVDEGKTIWYFDSKVHQYYMVDKSMPLGNVVSELNNAVQIECYEEG